MIDTPGFWSFRTIKTKVRRDLIVYDFDGKLPTDATIANIPGVPWQEGDGMELSLPEPVARAWVPVLVQAFLDRTAFIHDPTNEGPVPTIPPPEAP